MTASIQTAEGIETQAQLEFYREHDCDEYRGYYFARPGAPQVITRMIDESRASAAQPPLVARTS